MNLAPGDKASLSKEKAGETNSEDMQANSSGHCTCIRLTPERRALHFLLTFHLQPVHHARHWQERATRSHRPKAETQTLLRRLAPAQENWFNWGRPHLAGKVLSKALLELLNPSYRAEGQTTSFTDTWQLFSSPRPETLSEERRLAGNLKQQIQTGCLQPWQRAQHATHTPHSGAQAISNVNHPQCKKPATKFLPGRSRLRVKGIPQRILEPSKD